MQLAARQLADTGLVRRNGDPLWCRVPFSNAPARGGFNLVPLALHGNSGGMGRMTRRTVPRAGPRHGSLLDMI
jgi:hypothetical protein